MPEQLQVSEYDLVLLIMATAYHKLLSSIDWNDAVLIDGLREGLNKFLSNVYLKQLASRGHKKYECTQWASAEAIGILESGRHRGLCFEHVVPKTKYIQEPCETRAKRRTLTAEFIHELLRKNWVLATITHEQHKTLRPNDMDTAWDGQDLFARYSQKIELKVNPHFDADLLNVRQIDPS